MADDVKEQDFAGAKKLAVDVLNAVLKRLREYGKTHPFGRTTPCPLCGRMEIESRQFQAHYLREPETPEQEAEIQ